MLYTPSYAKPEDTAAIHELMERHSFAAVISSTESGPVISHLPMLFRKSAGANGTLVSHLARANPHSKLLDGRPVTCVFNGPHGYMSPAWYVDPMNVPTWNYAVAHVTGRARLIEDGEAIEAILSETVQKYEAEIGTGWRYELPAEFRGKLVKAIVGFEIPIDGLEGKFKLSQNRQGPDRTAALNGARKHYGKTNPELVRLMERAIGGP